MISSRNGRRKHTYGRLLDAKTLERGEAPQVPLGAEATDVRVMVGSHLDGEARFLAELNQCGGIERHGRVDHNAGPIIGRDPAPDRQNPVPASQSPLRKWHRPKTLSARRSND